MYTIKSVRTGKLLDYGSWEEIENYLYLEGLFNPNEPYLEGKVTLILRNAEDGKSIFVEVVKTASEYEEIWPGFDNLPESSESAPFVTGKYRPAADK